MAPKKQSQQNSTMSNEQLFEELNEQIGSASDNKVEKYISTGSTLLDFAISNRKDGGIPCR